MNTALTGEGLINEANTNRLKASNNVNFSFDNSADDGVLQIASPKRRSYDMDTSRSSEHTFDERSSKALIYTVSCSFNDDEDDDFSVSTTYSVYADVYPESPAKVKGKKCVRFAEATTVREFAITVGDPALSADSCPLTLDWMYSERQKRLKESARIRNLRRLNVFQRRERVAMVLGISLNEVRSIEIERVLERMEDTMCLQESYIEHLIEGDEESESGSEWVDQRALNIDGIREYRDEANQSSRTMLYPDRDWYRALPDESESEDSSHWLMQASLRAIDRDWDRTEAC